MKSLDLGLDEFKKLKTIDRDIVIYQNLNEVRSKIYDYRFHKHVQYVWLVILSIILGVGKYLGVSN